MKLVWTRLAIADRKEIRTYIAQDNPVAAIALDGTFSKKAEHLLAHPGLGRHGRVSGTHEWVVHKNYILVYDVAGNLIRILRVLHTAKQWPPVGK